MRHRQRIFVGTSGYSYQHWQGKFYPKDTGPRRWFDFYCRHFNAVEINNSFYRLPDRKTFAQWRNNSPSDFHFSVKGNRYITHMKKLKDPERPLGRFFEAVEGLGEKLAAILFQLPPRWRFNRERLSSFLKALPRDFSYAFEFRDDSWWNEETYELLEKHNAAFCIFDIDGRQSPTRTTSDMIYIRLHGPGRAYQGEYGIAALSRWAGVLSAWHDKGKSIHCYFDNDQNGYAAKDAQKLSRLLADRTGGTR